MSFSEKNELIIKHFSPEDIDILVSCYTSNKILRFKDQEVVRQIDTFKYGCPVPTEIEMLPNGNIILAAHDGVAEITPDDRRVNFWDVKDIQKSLSQWYKDRGILPRIGRIAGLHSAKLTPQKTLLLSNTIGNGCSVLEIKQQPSDTPQIVWEWTMPLALAESMEHRGLIGLCHINHALRLPNGNTLISIGACGLIVEVTPEGNIIWQFLCDDPTHNIQCLQNGNILFCARARVIETDRDGNIVWEWKSNAGHLGIKDADRLPDGNTLVCQDTGVIYIVDKDGDIIWDLNVGMALYEADMIINGTTLWKETWYSSMVKGY